MLLIQIHSYGMFKYIRFPGTFHLQPIWTIFCLLNAQRGVTIDVNCGPL